MMDSVAANNFIQANHENFPQDRLPTIMQTLETMHPQRLALLQALNFKDPVMFFTLGLLVGWLGIDRFLLGDVRIGLLKLCTLGGCTILWIIDIFRISAATKDKNYELFVIFAKGGGV